MNRFIKYFLFVLILSVLFSCEQTVFDDTKDGVPLSFSNLTFEDIQTRATLTDGSLGVFRLASSSYTSAKSNVRYNYVSSWTAASTPVYLNKSQATLNLYYPYNASYSNSTAIPLTSQVPGTNQANALWYSRMTVASTDLPLNLSLKQAYARMTFNFTHLASYTGNCAISNITISNSEIISTATLNIEDTDGYPYTAGTKGSVSFNPNISSIASGASDASGIVLMVPVASLTGNITFSVTIDGVVKTGTLSSTSLSSLLAGSNYQININIEKLGLTLVANSYSGSTNGSLISETANCYIVAPNQSITFPVNVKGNGSNSTIESGISLTHTAASASITWITPDCSIELSSFNASNQTLTITAGSNPGNALISVRDGSNVILWSWHIWVTNYNPYLNLNGSTYTFTNSCGKSFTFMDRNLGATTTTLQGNQNDLYYQFGRKDPIPGTGYSNPGKNSVVKLSMASVINDPTKIILTTGDWCSTNSDDWWRGIGGTDYIPGPKTIYDPCPAGWRVPYFSNFPESAMSYSPWVGLTVDNGVFSSGQGWTFSSPYNVGFYPFSGVRSNTAFAIYDVGTSGAFWTSNVYSATIGFGRCFQIKNSNDVTPSDVYNRSNGLSVRCVKE